MVRKAGIALIGMTIAALAAGCGGDERTPVSGGAPTNDGGIEASACPLDTDKLHAALGHTWEVDTTSGSCGFSVSDLGSYTQSVSVFYDRVDPIVYEGSEGAPVTDIGDGARWETDPVENLVVKDGNTYFEVQPVVFGNPSGFAPKDLAVTVARLIVSS